MITAPDFKMKQILFVLCNEGEKLHIQNDNLLVLDSEGKVKIQVTCYRLFLVNIVGNCSITNVLISKAKKFGFYIALYTYGFHLYQVIGANKEGNTLLKKKQYEYNDIALSKLIVKNKILAQYQMIDTIRSNDIAVKDTLEKIRSIYSKVDINNDLQSLLALEGIVAKMYFKVIFDNTKWRGRKPKIKEDFVNSSLDIGYTILFNFIDSILCSFGFDTYVGVYHTQFYMRKSLVCDIIEPFRPLIDKTIRNGINLKQISEDDFEMINNQYKLKYLNNTKYIKIFMKPILDNRELIFKYIQGYYRSFIKGNKIKDYPFVCKGEIINGPYKL